MHLHIDPRIEGLTPNIYTWEADVIIPLSAGASLQQCSTAPRGMGPPSEAAVPFALVLAVGAEKRKRTSH